MNGITGTNDQVPVPGPGYTTPPSRSPLPPPSASAQPWTLNVPMRIDPT